MNASYVELSTQRRGSCPPKQQKILRAPPLRGLALAILCLLVAAGSGCKITPIAAKSESVVHPREDIAATQEQIRLRMRAMVEPLSGAIIESANRIMAGTTNRVVRREALLWKMEAVPTLREALFRPNPFAAIMDSWVFMWQMTDYFESGRGREVMGAAAPIAVKTCQELATEIEKVTASITISRDVSDAAKFARKWAKEHPIEYSIASRESTLSRVTERELHETFSSQEVAGNVVVTLDDLTRRMDVYGTQLFDQARWQAELVAMDLASDYELEKAMPLAETMVQSATEAVATLKRLEPAVGDTLAVAKSTPEILGRERTATVQAAHEEISRTLEFVKAERLAALDYVTEERKAALLEMRQAIAAERKALSDDAEQIGRRMVDHAMLRVTQLTAAVLVAIFIGFVVLLFITRRIFATHREGQERLKA